MCIYVEMRENENSNIFVRNAAVFKLDRISFQRDSPHSRHARSHTYANAHLYIITIAMYAHILPYIKKEVRYI